ncbi:periplasmic divalent cation tolerance protein [Rhodothalassium salexigens DSM 2132]|uniref:Periplasmic divalent cation tolerance protein n=1 Tax=Rhodothalassium salexigens DSM 2132 TaxID=1188247 RepID=A0A4R2PRL1_RHOSA|nr:divalent-cation tolerance protein CutA [Rhodothalassium salexigens]MBB4210760.1 periplasmic divalent cation tolerance protein [Rhodothalassium salexigens DSM 2132]TCP37684.1 periplasmic divalent cation tolerance protein [Rhodothalassium salexigens DSM 2132]
MSANLSPDHSPDRATSADTATAAEAVTLYMTAASTDEALAIARALVAERLIACANVVDPVTSVFRWEGGVGEERETVVFMKTSRARADAAMARIVELHSYEVPCVTVLPVVAGNAGYLAWVKQETED